MGVIKKKWNTYENGAEIYHHNNLICDLNLLYDDSVSK